MNVDFGNDIYTIDFTDPANGNFAIQPFTTNGPLNPTSASFAPGATSASTTLTLVGRGLPGWGESVIENLVHMLEHFSGPTAPTYMVPGQMWFDTTGGPTDGVLKVRSKDNATWNPVLTTGTDLDFGGFKGINVGDATDPTDAMNQQSSDARYVNVTGDAMNASTNLTFSAGGEVLGLPATPSATGASSKEYVDTQIPLVTDPLYVNVAGDTMTGVLTLFADPVASLQAATKQYVDNNFVELGGDVMSGFLTLSANPTIAFHAATKQYVDAAVTSVGGDGVVDTGFFSSFVGNGTITLTRTEGLPDVSIININSHPHGASEVTYQTPEQGQRLENVFPTSFTSGYTQDFANSEFDRAAQQINVRNRRQFALGSDFGGATFAMAFSYPTESNRLQVFLHDPAVATGVGGRKLVADERGLAVIDLGVLSIVQTGAFESQPTGLPNDATLFSFTVNVDGGGATAVSVTGASSQIFGGPGGLVAAMNAAFVGGGVPAVAEFDVEDSAILIWSDTTGGASSVVVVDTGLFAALTAEASVFDWTLVTGATLPAAGPAAWFDVSSTTVDYRFWFMNGATTIPALGGRTAVAVPFVGGETNQAISDLVLTGLTVTAADADFAAATNGGGSSPIITMTLASVGSVLDVSDGLVPTGANIFVAQEGVTTGISSVAGVTYDYSEDGPALTDSTSFTLPGAPAAADEFEIIRIK